MRRRRTGLLLVGGLVTAVAGAAPVTAQVPGDAAIDLERVVHDSRDGLFRTPGGAVPAGTTVTLRIATAAGDAEAAVLRLRDDVANATRTIELERAAADAPCPPPAPDPCDLWATTIETDQPTTLRYRFALRDGDATAGYADGPTLDGGLGRATRFDADFDYAITVHDPAFTTPDWLRGAVVYQVFPDRFANGDPGNDADESEPRYGYPPDPNAQVRRRAWEERPEQPPRGRDFYGGDLAGLAERLPSLREIGVEVVYLNPIFAAGSNHLYDTRDYRRIDPRFGSDEDWNRLVAAADAAGIRLILDGVFNHVGSDSPYFDRYGHWDEVGACESVDSPYRSWFLFRDQPDGPCAGPAGPNTQGYFSWANFDSLPVLAKTDPAVVELVYGGNDAIAREWLRRGAAGWRLDVMMDASFPDGFWAGFREAVKATKPDAAIVGELWKKDEILPKVRGDAADTFMNYRFRNAMQGYLGRIDNKGFPDDGQGGQPPTVFADKIDSVLEDVPEAAWSTALNLVGTHDTERILWSLAPGSTPAEKEAPENLELAKERLRVAALLQYSLPGAPTIYYGDEVGVTGGNDPDDRRTYPLDGGDADLRGWYERLAEVRAANPVLRDGELRWLLLDDATGVLAFARLGGAAGRGAGGTDGAAVVVANPSDRSATVIVPVLRDVNGDWALREGVTLEPMLAGGGDPVVAGEFGFEVTLEPRTAQLFVAAADQDLEAPAAPAEASVAAAGDAVDVDWATVDSAAGYVVERSFVAGGGFEEVTRVDAPGFRDAEAPPGSGSWVYRVRAVDEAGNVSEPSGEVRLEADAPTASPAPGAGASPSPGPSPDDGRQQPEPGGQPPLLLALVLLVGILAVGALALRRVRGP